MGRTARRRAKEEAKRKSGFRVCVSALVFVGLLLAVSFGWTAWDRTKESGAGLWTELEAVLREVEPPLALLLASPTPKAQAVSARAYEAPSVAALPSPSPRPSPTPPAPVAAQGKQALPLLVNGDHMLPADYRPSDLVNMVSYCPSDVVTVKDRDIQGQREAVDALITMFRAAQAQGITVWQVSAGYRSLQYQRTVFDDQVYTFRKENNLSPEQAVSAAQRYVAEPGASEHHTGLAFDITVPEQSFRLTKQSDWLAAHCWDYGFVIRYQEGKETITGIAPEPWHIRYVGTPHAQIMRENNWCLEEYVAQPRE